jgi:hypothetical protein
MNQFHPLANPEAGNHPLPDAPLEIEAALRAGQHSWEACPYYDLRYGERGRRFTRSDSGYLVALTQQDAFHVREQVAWLARVLASRGMPTWLLERHLYALYSELCAAMPAQRSRYEKLREAADWLNQRRVARIGESAGRALAGGFHRHVADDPWLARLREPGLLLIAAVADERNDLAEAVPSLLAWLADPQRFQPSWIAAVEATLAAARPPGPP